MSILDPIEQMEASTQASNEMISSEIKFSSSISYLKKGIQSGEISMEQLKVLLENSCE